MQFTWPSTPITLTIGRQDASWGPGIVTKADNRDRFKIVGAFDVATVVAPVRQVHGSPSTHDTASLDDRSPAHRRRRRQGPPAGTSAVSSPSVPDGTVQGEDTTPLRRRWLRDGQGRPRRHQVRGRLRLTGKTDYDAAAKADVDLSGMGVYAGAIVPAGPVTVGVEGAYVSGDDPSTTNKNEGALRSDYHGPFWSVILFNNLDLQRVPGRDQHRPPTPASPTRWPAASPRSRCR